MTLHVHELWAQMKYGGSVTWIKKTNALLWSEGTKNKTNYNIFRHLQLKIMLNHIFTIKFKVQLILKTK